MDHKERKIYLSNTDLEEAVKLYLTKLKPAIDSIRTELTDVPKACGRVTSKPVFARLSSPNHNAAAMDGIMAIADRTYAASEATPVILNQGVDFEYINTGHVVRDPFDCVIMIEDVVALGEGKVKVILPAAPWQHIRPIGEDMVAGEMILPEHHQIRPMDIGAMLGAGCGQVEVFEQIRIGIMPTGNEITDDYQALERGATFDSNSWIFHATAVEMGALPERIPPVADEYELLKQGLLGLLERNHLVVINAGSSAGSKDYTAKLIEELGELVLHGIAIKPGKPTILGMVQGKPVIGVPGYPGSAFLVFEEVVGRVIRSMQRIRYQRPPQAMAILSRRLVSSLKYREYVRVKLGRVGEKLIATPLNRGAGVMMALVKADGLLVVPRNSEGYEAGETVSVELITDLDLIDNTLVSIGSHDLIMDHIANLLSRKGIGLSSAHVGSMGGILALKRGEAHLAPIHLLDEETGEYNRSYLERYLKGENVKLIKGVRREQGFLVRPGNPKGILGIQDLTRPDVSFVNRQKGSGTRILTDYLLTKAGIDIAGIRGYDRDMTTHMAVAAAVESGSADVGVGVASAAHAMGLDFISIGFEEYDFAIPERYLQLKAMQEFLTVLQSVEFQDILAELGGYGV